MDDAAKLVGCVNALSKQLVKDSEAERQAKKQNEAEQRRKQRRAESVVRYLIAHGIVSDRLTPKGYGESRPKVVTRKMAERTPFLHEGDTLTEKFILALDSEEKQETCHALNRRTEFRVLRTTYGLFDKRRKEEKEGNQASEN